MYKKEQSLKILKNGTFTKITNLGAILREKNIH